MSLMNHAADRLKEIIGLETEPIAVFLGLSNQPSSTFDSFRSVAGQRYCQLLMQARRGESVRLVGDELACPAAAAAFGFRPLPEALATGKGLVGFGIVAEAETGRRMFEAMPRLQTGAITEVAACPLSLAPATPDVIVIEGTPEQLMWLLLADLNTAHGQRRQGNTAVLQATCVDATLIPFLGRRMNFTLGCYGCREATDLAPTETVLGFPASDLEPLMVALENLNLKAVGRSRAKATLHHLNGKKEQA